MAHRYIGRIDKCILYTFVYNKKKIENTITLCTTAPNNSIIYARRLWLFSPLRGDASLSHVISIPQQTLTIYCRVRNRTINPTPYPPILGNKLPLMLSHERFNHRIMRKCPSNNNALSYAVR